MADESNQTAPQHESLSLWDAVSIIVGIVVGVSIFKAPSIIFANVQTPLAGLAAWGLGTVIALCGALTYAELATLQREAGGEYVYLTRAYGRWIGFLFGWAQLTGVFSGSIAQMAYVFADYARQWLAVDVVSTSTDADPGVWIAVAVIAVITGVHVCGVRTGKTVQNLLTIVKVVGLAGLLVVGFASTAPEVATAGTAEVRGPGFALAMILVLYAFGGWNDTVFVAAEVRQPERNVPRALILGLTFVAGLYLLVNLALLKGMGFGGVRASSAPAWDLVENSSILGPAAQQTGARAIGLLVMISAVGAVHGLIFTGSRLFAALGRDHSVFKLLGHWHPKTGSPVWSLTAQGLLAVLLTLIVGTSSGQSVVDGAAVSLGGSPVPWQDYGGGFETLVAGTAPVFWSFFFLSGLSLFIFRLREPNADRPFRVPLFPVVPAAFCLSSAWMVWSSLTYAGWLTLIAVVPLVFGVPLYLLSRKTGEAMTAS
ncbi:MAG: APC family permease [Planctomycetota bacterium]|jgi:amino acid transporter